MVNNSILSRTRVEYFSMEIALRPEIHTYAGGLGILAGDTARSCGDLNLPVVFVTLASRKGYMRQEIDGEGWQSDYPDLTGSGLLPHLRNQVLMFASSYRHFIGQFA